ncbi:MAG: PAS domain-containing protein [Rhodospirillaceae bacterium]|nr:PAS domain-containing protein [Rhodospirillaceae bacterium]
MTRPTVPPTGIERTWPDTQLIVSKTDTKGIITYANKVFCGVAGYQESELVGQNHNIIRHPDMPRCVFKLLWDTVQAGEEIFAYVVNQAKLGDHYWVLAHVTPTFDSNMRIIGYHSSRRVPRRDAVDGVIGLYRQLLAIEAGHSSPKDGMAASEAALMDILKAKGVAYDEFVFSL